MSRKYNNPAVAKQQALDEEQILVRLVSAIIEQAINDYRLCVDAGLIIGTTVLDCNFRRKVCCFHADHDALEILAKFFRRGEGMDQLIETANIQVSGDQIRRKLGIE